MHRLTALLAATGMAAAAAVVIVAAQSSTPGQPARDTPAQQSAAQQAPPTASISGRVVAADTGRPISRARVNLSTPQGGGRVALTDDAGAFDLTDLPDGRYTLQVSKTGFIALQYGQRRPLQAGTPIQLAPGQSLHGIDFRLPRGGVISGHVLDENNDPMPGVQVQVLAYRYAQGARTLSPAGSGQSDDRGEYRVWGLNPGDYYVSVTPPPGFGSANVGRGSGPGRGAPPGSDEPPLSYAPTYYPGVSSVSDARPITVDLSGEVSEISFSILLVKTAHVSGHVANADGTPAAGGTLSLASDDSGRSAGPAGRGFGAPVRGDGQFSFANVPPGRYTLRARSGNGRGRGNVNQVPMFASTPLVVTGDDVTDVSLVLAPGVGLSGAATFQTTQSASPPNINQFRVSAPPTTADGTGNGQTQLDAKTATFNIDGLSPGEHILQTQTPRGWTLASATIDGRDVADRPFDLKSGQNVTTVALAFTDKVTEVEGTVADAVGDPIPDYTVLVFPQDDSLWRPQSREIMTARPDQNGHYQMTGLPAGQYYTAIIDPAVQGEWFDPAFLEAQRAGAQRFQLGDGEVRTQDFTVSR